jgi:flagellin-specific chaperone FliS
MIALHTPSEAYRRVDFDARVHGADPRQLVSLCYEQLTTALGSALFAHEAGDNARKSAALTRALTSITALQMGISGEGGMAAALHQLYESARRSLLDCVLVFDAKAIAMLRDDFNEIARAMAGAR